MTAADDWREALEGWGIPPDILAVAPESPWGFPTDLFAHRAELARSELTFSNTTALAALPVRGSVLDVGCGGGAASVPLAANAGSVTGVDAAADMLTAFTSQLERSGTSVRTLQGTWPEIASAAPVADVVVCHHVAYNAPDLAGLALELTGHARARVVLELTERHPMSRLNDLWLHFHGIRRPERPTAGDAVAVLQELGYTVDRHDWQNPAQGWLAQFASRADLTAWLRRRLCLRAERDMEIWEQIRDQVVERDGAFSLPPLPVVTLWWPGGAVTAGG